MGEGVADGVSYLRRVRARWRRVREDVVGDGFGVTVPGVQTETDDAKVIVVSVAVGEGGDGFGE